MKEEQIRNALDGMDPEVLKDALALLLSRGGVTSSQESRNKVADATDFQTFAQAILYLKSKYKFSELNKFTTEADLVYVNTGDRKVLLTSASAPQRERRYEALRSETEDDFFANSYEPVEKVSRREQGIVSVSSDALSSVGTTTEENNNDKPNKKNDGDGDQKKGGRFSLLEI